MNALPSFLLSCMYTCNIIHVYTCICMYTMHWSFLISTSLGCLQLPKELQLTDLSCTVCEFSAKLSTLT